MKTAVVIQARASSSRLPDKIFLPLPWNGNKSVLGHVVERSRKACPLVIVATTEEPGDDRTAAEAVRYGAEVFRGSLTDVMERYLGAAETFSLDNMVRITSDCPCIDPEIISATIKTLEETGAEYVSNVEKRTFPHGLDTEAFAYAALKRAAAAEKRPEIREHVTLAIRRSDEFKKADYLCGGKAAARPDIRVTLDTEEDYTALLLLFSELGSSFGWRDIVRLYENNPWLERINGRVYQKRAFSGRDEEMTEAVKLLKLHNMFQAASAVEKARR